MKIEILLITPEMAKAWLGLRGPNRRLKPGGVEKYAQDMREGRWRLTHQGIAFDKNGNLIDGQHRLSAIVMSGVSVMMVVTHGVEDVALPDIDIVLKRTVPDCVKISTGKALHGHVVSLCNAMRRGMFHVSSTGRGKTMSPEQALAWLERHGEAIEFASELVGSGGKSRGLGRADVAAVMARAYYHAPGDRIATFYKIVSNTALALQSNEPGAGSALMLNQYLLMATTGYGGSVKALRTYAKTSRALKAFLDGQSLAKLYDATTELFPLPEDSSK